MGLFLSHIRLTDKNYSLQSLSVLKVQGDKAAEYIHRQVTSEVLKASHGTFHLSCILEQKGQLVTWFLLLKRSEREIFLCCPKICLANLEERLKRYIIAEDLEISTSDLRVHVHPGPLRSDMMASVSSYAGDLPWGGANEIILENGPAFSFSEEEERALFLSSGLPTGHLLEATRPPLVTETFLIERAVDFSKGCFLGQEVAAKIHHRKGSLNFASLLKADNAEDALSLVKIFSDKTLLTKFEAENRATATNFSFFVMDDLPWLYCHLRREFRVQNSKITLKNGEQSFLFRSFSLPLHGASDEELANEIFIEGARLNSLGKTEEAISLLEKGLHYRPGDLNLLEVLGVIYGQQKNYPVAADYMQRLLEQDPLSVMAHSNLSIYALAEGDKEKAEFHKAQSIANQFRKQGEILKQQNQSEKEEKKKREQRKDMFLKVLAIDPDDPMASTGLAEFFLTENQHKEARELLLNAIDHHPSYSHAYLLLGRIYKDQGRPKDALKTWEKAREVALKNGQLQTVREADGFLVTVLG